MFVVERAYLLFYRILGNRFVNMAFHAVFLTRLPGGGITYTSIR